jgi:hypothetical protein
VASVATPSIKAFKVSTTPLYRAVSKAEFIDIPSNGLRTIGGNSYETGKLFATTSNDAVQFGLNNYKFDQKPFTVIKVQVSNKVMKTATTFTADGMKAVSIPSNQLSNIKPKLDLSSGYIWRGSSVF